MRGATFKLTLRLSLSSFLYYRQERLRGLRSTHNNTMFVNGDLKGKFIMDRNLGARDTSRAVDGVGALHYMFGRKDPFTTDYTDYGSLAYVGRWGDDNKWMIELSSGTTNVATAVNNPMIFYTPGIGLNWCEAVDSVTYLWQDYEQDADGGGKSIFDPSPKGWKVPHVDTWSNFSTSTMTDWVYAAENDQIGRSYTLVDDKFAYYPAYGCRRESGVVAWATTLGVYWSSTPSSSITGGQLHTQTTTVNNTASHGRGTGHSIRCVQHDE